MVHYNNGFLALALLALLLCGSALGKKVHLQWAICDTNASTVLHKLGLDPDEEPYKANNITYYDLSLPIYTAQGLAFRTKIHKHEPISLIKARFDKKTKNVPSEAECVWDRYGNNTYFTCGLPSPLEDRTGIWSEDQIAFAERYQNIAWDDLVPYGPFLNPKWKWRDFAGLGYKAVFDDVIAPVEVAGSSLRTLHLMEIEIAVKKSKSAAVHKNITKYLVDDCGIVICEPVQLSKTLRLFGALEDLSQQESIAVSGSGNGQLVLEL